MMLRPYDYYEPKGYRVAQWKGIVVGFAVAAVMGLGGLGIEKARGFAQDYMKMREAAGQGQAVLTWLQQPVGTYQGKSMTRADLLVVLEQERMTPPSAVGTVAPPKKGKK